MTVNFSLRKLCALLFCIGMILALMPKAHANAAASEGFEPLVITESMVGQGNIKSEHLGYYAISTPDELLWFMEHAMVEGDASALLIDDITLNDDLTNYRIEIDPLSGEPFVRAGIHVEQWTPIPSFSGVIDGGGHRIFGLYIKSADENTGLVSTLAVGGAIKNLEIRNSYVYSASNSVGVIAGINCGEISGVSVYSDVTSGGDRVGAIVGENRGKIEKCSFHGIGQGKNYVGAIAGLNLGEIGYCFAEDGKYDLVGNRFVGSISGKNDGKIYSSYSMKTSRGESLSLSGTSADDAIFDNCFYLSDTETDSYTGTLHKSNAAFLSGEVCYLLNNGDEVFCQTVGEGSPMFSGDIVYLSTVKNCPFSETISEFYSNVPESTVYYPNHNYEFECSSFCEFCGYERNNAKMHTYVSNCDEICDICDEIRVAPHDYDNPCDSDCNSCDATRDTEHKYDTVCSEICNICGSDRVTIHSFDNACDTVCNLCEKVRDVPPHEYDNFYDEDCNACGYIREIPDHECVYICGATCATCGNILSPKHEYDNDCDSKCNICSFVREVWPHIYDNACDPLCNICGDKRKAADHTYDNACDSDCNICGEKRAVSDHQYDNPCDRNCNICDLEREVADHVYDNACDAICNLCFGERITADHIYDNSCDNSCNECNYIRETEDHIYTSICDSDCNICGKIRNAADHEYENSCDSDCNNCGEVRAATDHIYDNDCDDSCNACGKKRDPAEHIFGEYFIVLEPTETEEGIESRECKICGKRESRKVDKLGTDDSLSLMFILISAGVVIVVVAVIFVAVKIYGKIRLARFD